MNSEELKDIPFFRNIPEDAFKAVMHLVGEEHFKAGEVIFEEGSSADKFFIIRDGEVEIRKIIDKKDSTYKLIAILVKGEFFGEMALFLGQTRSAEAVAKNDVMLTTVSKKDLSTLFSHSPETAFKVMEVFASVLTDRLRNTTNELAFVYETGRLVIASHSVLELSGHVMENAFNAVDTDAGLFVVWNRFNREFEVYSQRGFHLEAGASLSDDDPIIQWLEKNKEPFLSFDLKNDKRISITDNDIYNGHSLVASPFLSRGRLLGFVLLLSRTMPNAFSHEHMILLSAISGYVSVALENLQYMQEEIDRARLRQAKSTIPL